MNAHLHLNLHLHLDLDLHMYLYVHACVCREARKWEHHDPHTFEGNPPRTNVPESMFQLSGVHEFKGMLNLDEL